MKGIGFETAAASAGGIDEGRALPGRRWLPAGRWPRVLALAYVAVLHVALALLVAKTDFLERLQRRHGIGFVPAKEFDTTYQRMGAALARADARVRPGALVFLGDSIMRDLDASSIARHTINMAIPGDTTARILRRASGYSSILTARGVVLGVGVNDLAWRSIPETLANYRRIVDLLPPTVPLLAVAVLPVDERASRDLRNADIRRLNEGVAELCAGRPRCRFVDPTPRLADGGGNLAAVAHEGDGLHLSAVGHDIYWDAINEAVLGFMPAAE